jgi:hypothetical protein
MFNRYARNWHPGLFGCFAQLDTHAAYVFRDI